MYLAFALLPLAAAAPDSAEDDPQSRIVVVGQPARAPQDAPASHASIDADRIATTVNAASVEDAVKYLPSLVVRKRHIGDTQAPLATRTSGLGASARSLIYADGALLSALIGNNNTIASPRWGLVAPEEIARIDVLYGPFSAAYPGNSIGAVVNITTRLPDRLEGSLTALANLQDFHQYGTDALLPTYQTAATLGGRIGPLALFASATHTDSRGQPLNYVTAIRPAPGPAGAPATGGFDALNRTGAPIRVLGASGIEHQRQDTIKLKAALDLGDTRLAYVGGLFLGDTAASAETYLSGASGALYAGSVNVAGYPYTIAPSAFSAGAYTHVARHWSHSLSATGSSTAFEWQVIGTHYDFGRDVQRTPTGALPTGGAGQIVRLEGTGWRTLDAMATWRGGANTLGFGAHWDQFAVDSDRYSTTDWANGPQGPLNLASRGKTRTAALWAQDALRLGPSLTLMLGGRYEWWRAYDGLNYSLSPALSVAQPPREARGFSPKASIEWRAAPGWSARLSVGKAYRFPTVGELYQAVTTGATITVPDPSLRPERALSEELAIEHGPIHLSLFNESVADALISQSAPLVPGSTTLFNYVQNVERTRAHGAELAFDRHDLLPRLDLTASATYTDSATARDAAFPAAVGKLLPSVPRWKASAVVTWRPTDQIALTAAARYASRNYATLDNSDTVGNTFQGFYRYLVVDLRARFRLTDRAALALGVDNVGNDKYFLFHPFPQRAFTAELDLKL